jgi:hypothetical protein
MFNFKTCLSVVITTSEPERKFVRLLSQLENAQHITAWIKNADTGFYGIEYSYSRGDFSKRGIFNPDFFILIGKSDLLVVEVKGDEELTDPSPENKGKEALEYFRTQRPQNETDTTFAYQPQGLRRVLCELQGRARPRARPTSSHGDGPRIRNRIVTPVEKQHTHDQGHPGVGISLTGAISA